MTEGLHIVIAPVVTTTTSSLASIKLVNTRSSGKMAIKTEREREREREKVKLAT